MAGLKLAFDLLARMQLLTGMDSDMHRSGVWMTSDLNLMLHLPKSQ
jgi:hypothetical protein